MNKDELLYIAITAAYSAGFEILKVRNRKNMCINIKKDNSFVTCADINANNVIISALSKTNIPIISEESIIPIRTNIKTIWIIDPLDGTSEFVKGGPEFTVNLALVKDHKVILGVVYVPMTKELYFAHNEIGSYKYVGDMKQKLSDYLNVSKKLPYTKTDKTTIVASKLNLDKKTKRYIYNIVNPKDNKGRIKPLNVEYINRSSSLKFCMIAEGTADIYPRMSIIYEWDTAAAHAIIKFSGKNVYDIYGNELLYNKLSLKSLQFIAK